MFCTHRDKLPKLGRYIDSGSEGRVYFFNRKKVIKVVYDDYDIGAIRSHIEKLNKIKSKYMPKIFEFGSFGRKKSPAGYYYIMEYLPRSLSIKERDALPAYYTRADEKTDKHHLFGKCNDKNIKNLFKWLNRKGLFIFDLHTGNIRKTKKGILKIIDFEGIIINKLKNE